MLVAEFNLLSAYEKSSRDLQKAKISNRWTGRLPTSQHPCLLKWELMQQMLNKHGGQIRCEAVCANDVVCQAVSGQPGDLALAIVDVDLIKNKSFSEQSFKEHRRCDLCAEKQN